MRYLLDVNMLLAAIWTTHDSHKKAITWIEGKKLASCAISEIGFLRISTHPKALNSDMVSARTLLEIFLKEHAVEFFALDLPSLESRAASSDAVTDIYLADFAQSKGCKFATLDRGIRHPAVEAV
jgi:predicted nucleic acid-binding protein